jgi:hypothetical protein
MPNAECRMPNAKCQMPNRSIFQMDADGNVDWEVARSKLPPDVSQDDFDHVFDRCKDIGKCMFPSSSYTLSLVSRVGKGKNREDAIGNNASGDSREQMSCFSWGRLQEGG